MFVSAHCGGHLRTEDDKRKSILLVLRERFSDYIERRASRRFASRSRKHFLTSCGSGGLALGLLTSNGCLRSAIRGAASRRSY
jgi:hypothetical protein